MTEAHTPAVTPESAAHEILICAEARGSVAGFFRHYRAKDPTCPECAEAKRLADKKRKAEIAADPVRRVAEANRASARKRERRRTNPELERAKEREYRTTEQYETRKKRERERQRERYRNAPIYRAKKQKNSRNRYRNNPEAREAAKVRHGILMADPEKRAAKNAKDRVLYRKRRRRAS